MMSLDHKASSSSKLNIYMITGFKIKITITNNIYTVIG
jgi:hypothetical protein